MRTSQRNLKIELQQFETHSPNEFEAAFLAMAKRHIDAIVFQEDAVFLSNLSAIADFAARQSLPFAGSRSGRPDQVRGGFSRNVSPRGRVCGQDYQRRQARRHPG
jgi:hypothetical protein